METQAYHIENVNFKGMSTISVILTYFNSVAHMNFK